MSSLCPRCGSVMQPVTKGAYHDKWLACSHCGYEQDVPDEATVEESEEIREGGPGSRVVRRVTKRVTRRDGSASPRPPEGPFILPECALPEGATLLRAEDLPEALSKLPLAEGSHVVIEGPAIDVPLEAGHLEEVLRKVRAEHGAEAARAIEQALADLPETLRGTTGGTGPIHIEVEDVQVTTDAHTSLSPSRADRARDLHPLERPARPREVQEPAPSATDQIHITFDRRTLTWLLVGLALLILLLALVL